MIDQSSSQKYFYMSFWSRFSGSSLRPEWHCLVIKRKQISRFARNRWEGLSIFTSSEARSLSYKYFPNCHSERSGKSLTWLLRYTSNNVCRFITGFLLMKTMSYTFAVKQPVIKNSRGYALTTLWLPAKIQKVFTQPAAQINWLPVCFPASAAHLPGFQWSIS